MIRHIVMFKLKDVSNENLTKTRDILLSMDGRVPEIIDMEVGVDFLHSSRSYDISLSVLIEDEKALSDYQNDEYHVNVVKTHMHKVRESSIAVDYYLN